MATMTMARPASMPISIFTWPSARTTGLPRPSAPTKAAITTMDSANMIAWVTPAMMVGMAWGSSTFQSNCRLVAPKASPASINWVGTEETPR
jgi:hypothetical protein